MILRENGNINIRVYRTKEEIYETVNYTIGADCRG
jgi:hypothetical protein